MKYTRLSLVAFLGLVSSVQAQIPVDKVVSTFQVSNPKLEIALWASEPLFANPTCMDIDPKGRVWICESVNYRHTLHHMPPRRAAGDRIVILEDTKGQGKADKATTFYQSPELLAPLGIAVAKDPGGPGYKVYVCQSPDILLFEDKDGDGKADGPPKKLLSGFNGFDHDHGVHGILIGPDNKLYFSVGDTGVHGLVDKKGKAWTSNQTDCRAGTIWRCDLDGRNVELLAHNFRNEYEPCVDSFGTIFVSDNDDDGNQQTRICYVMPGGNYGYHPRGPGQTHWHEEQPGVVHKILRTYFGSPTGICFYEGKLLPSEYQGQLLHTDAGPRQVRCYHLRPELASYAVDREDMVTSSDNWFRPADVCVAPDGSAYVADWYDPGVGGHGMGDTTRGRIYRVAPWGAKSTVPPIQLNSREGLLEALASPALSVRYMAMARLDQMGDAALPVLEAGASQKENVWLRARSLWQLAHLGSGGRKWVDAAFQDADPRFRVQAIRMEKDFYNTSPAVYPSARKQTLLKDPNPAVCRELLLALRDEDAAKAKPMILDLARRYDGRDRFYLNALGIAVGQDNTRRETILADFDQRFPQWDNKVADLVWELRPPRVVALLTEKLSASYLPSDQAVRIVDILAAAPEDEAGKALLRFVGQNPRREVRDRIVDNLKLFLPGKWQSLRHCSELKDAVANLLVVDEASALQLIGVAEKADAVGKVVTIAAGEENSLAIRVLAVETLGHLSTPESVASLKKLIENKNLSLRQEAVAALGKLANPQALAALKEIATNDRMDILLRQTAISSLAGGRPGTLWLLDALTRKKVPGDLRIDAIRLLRNSPYQDLRNRAMVVFPPPSRLDLKKLPEMRTLLALKGDIEHGQQLFKASIHSNLQCLKCHTVRGTGGSVGPDLSMIGKKVSRENLLDSILFPSKAIADQYISWIVETRNGLVLTGLLVEEAPDFLTLRDANGKDTRIARADIETRAKSPNSLMPADLSTYMSAKDLTDLVEYLLTLKTFSLTLDSWQFLGPFANGPGGVSIDQVYPPEGSIDFNAAYQGRNTSIHWRQVKASDKKFIDLPEPGGKASGATISYLFRALDSPAGQEATLFVGSEDRFKVWLNGKLVYSNAIQGGVGPEEKQIKVNLRKGKNALLVKLKNGNTPQRFYFRLEADQEVKTLEK